MCALLFLNEKSVELIVSVFPRRGTVSRPDMPGGSDASRCAQGRKRYWKGINQNNGKTWAEKLDEAKNKIAPGRSASTRWDSQGERSEREGGEKEWGERQEGKEEARDALMSFLGRATCQGGGRGERAPASDRCELEGERSSMRRQRWRMGKSDQFAVLNLNKRR